MYTKPIIYKIYSVVIFVISVIGFITSLVYAINGADKLSAVLPSEYSSGSTVYLVCMVIAALISLFFAYVEFTSMFTFAQMIEHEESGSTEPFRRMSMVFAPKFFKVFGSVMFYIPLIADFIAAIVVVIAYSVAKKAFLAIPVIPIAIMVLSLFLTYITYYCRYRTFGDLLDLKSSPDASVKTLDSLRESKPNVLRGYCVFLFVLGIICAVGLIVAVFIISGTLSHILGSGLAVAVDIGIVVYAIVLFMIYGIIGCYYDNLAKMLEHYMIEYKLL